MKFIGGIEMKSKKLVLILFLTATCLLSGCSNAEKSANTGNGSSTGGTQNISGTESNTDKSSIDNGTDLLGNYTYENGTYRGSYVDGDINQISVEFVIKDNKYESLKYRALAYKGEDYLKEDATGVIKNIRDQYQQVADYLVGKEIKAVNDLYKPGEIAKDMDAVTGATLRSNKLISAIWDGLNRHPYKLAE